MIITGLDIETTGLKQEEGHRIIEVGLAMYQTTDGVSFRKLGNTWVQRINPMRAIDPGAQRVHGIDITDLKGSPEWGDAAGKINKFLKYTDLLIAHNAAFDAPFIALELMRAGYDMPDFEVFCTMMEGRQVTSMGKLPSLGELAWAFGRTYDTSQAHAADYDIELTMDCFFDGLKQGVFTPPIFNKLTAQAQS